MTSGEALGPQDREKAAVAEWAVGLIRPGMVVGLGSGSTAAFALRALGRRVADGELTDVVGVPTSEGVAADARHLGIALADLADRPRIDLTIDGADEVDPRWNLIKGGGGALLREKIVAQASEREVIVIDHTKLSPTLGLHHRLPIEVDAFGWRPEALHLESMGAQVDLRRAADGSVFRTDGGNLILDVDLGAIDDPPGLATLLLARAGVVQVGLFCGLVSDLVIAGPDGVTHRTAPGAGGSPPAAGTPLPTG